MPYKWITFTFGDSRTLLKSNYIFLYAAIYVQWKQWTVNISFHAKIEFWQTRRSHIKWKFNNQISNTNELNQSNWWITFVNITTETKAKQNLNKMFIKLQQR